MMADGGKTLFRIIGTVYFYGLLFIAYYCNKHFIKNIVKKWFEERDNKNSVDKD